MAHSFFAIHPYSALSAIGIDCAIFPTLRLNHALPRLVLAMSGILSVYSPTITLRIHHATLAVPHVQFKRRYDTNAHVVSHQVPPFPRQA